MVHGEAQSGGIAAVSAFVTHEIVLEPCGFTNIAVVSAPYSGHIKSTTPRKNDRWLVWVDKRRGMLGRTAITCPNQVDPPPGNRQFLAPQARPIMQSELGDIDLSKVVRTRRSIPLLTGLAIDADVDLGSTQHGYIGGIHQQGRTCAVAEASHTLLVDQMGSDRKRDCKTRRFPSESAIGKVHSPRESRGNAVSITTLSGQSPDSIRNEVLLSGLKQPSRVAVQGGSETKGVFFIDCAGVKNNGASTATKSLQSGADQAGTTESNRAAAVGQLRFLRWGERQAVTIVERLCNPIALWVDTDSSAFVLEESLVEASQKRKCWWAHHRQNRRYKVCRLSGDKFSAWLDNMAEKKLTVGKEISGSNDFIHRDCKGEHQHGVDRNPVLGFGTESYTENNLSNDGSETEWETSSDSTSGFGKHGGGIQGVVVAHVAAKALIDRFRRRGVVEFVDLFVLPLPPKNEDPAEQPVDLCVLPEGTVVVAFRRSTPLHDGAAVTENQGVVRAFPATYGTGNAHSQTSIDVSETPVEESAGGQALGLNNAQPLTYDTDNSWLVADGLPVITSVTPSSEFAIYVSFCGAGRDGIVTAICSLPTKKGQPAISRQGLEVSTGGEGRVSRGGGEKEEQTASGLSGQGVWQMSSARREDGKKHVRVVSGFAASLAVDGDNNIFYVTAESRGTCRALWCAIPGASKRRRKSIQDISPALPIKLKEPKIEKERGVVVRTVGANGPGSPHTKETGKISRQARRVRARVEAAEAAEAIALALAKRAAALSAAMFEEDDSGSLSRGSRSSLFAAHGTNRVETRGVSESRGTNSEIEEEVPVNIVVVSRCRPLLATEIKRGVRTAVFCDGDEIVISGKELQGDRSRRFGFDRVFGPRTSQARVYQEAVAPVVRKMLDGYNCSVLAYGQTGSGKTFTMEGGLSLDPRPADTTTGNTSSSQHAVGFSSTADDDPSTCIEKMGIIPRAVHTIFREGDGQGSRRYWIYVSHMEIYNERLFDLLLPDTANVSPSSPPPTRGHRFPRASGSGGSPRPIRESPRGGSPRPLPSSRRPSPCRNRGNTADPLSARDISPNPSPRRSHPGVKSGTCVPVDEEPLSGATRRSPRRTRPSASQPSSGSGYDGNGSGAGVWNAGSGIGRGLTIEENSDLGVIVKGLTQVEVKSPEDIFSIIARSKSNRRTAETMCNVESSRSHGVFSVRVISSEPTPWGGEITRDGRLSLVDLSGSENIKRSGAVGARAKEAAAIGQSLLALGRVIKALVKRAPHIPYRESKLTRVLGDSLGGNAFTAIILNVTPNHGMLDETLNTLSYAKTAQSVKNTPKQRIANNPVPSTASVLSDVHTLDCNTSEGIKPWKMAASTRPSPDLSRLHIRPWESKVPIHAPFSSLIQSKMTQQNYPSSLSLPPPDRSHENGGNGVGDCSGENAYFCLPRWGKDDVPSHVNVREKRPATAGQTSRGDRATPIDPMASPGYALPGSAAKGHVRRLSSDREIRYSRGAGANAVTRGPSLSRSEQQLLSRTNHELGSRDALKNSGSTQKNYAGVATSYSTLKGLREGGGDPTNSIVADRVFDSTAAEWVRSVVLEPANHIGTHIVGQEKRDRPKLTGPLLQVDDTRLTTAAQRAVEEVFDRYDSKSRGLLSSNEILALQGLWTFPDMEPPPSRLPPSSPLRSCRDLQAFGTYQEPSGGQSNVRQLGHDSGTRVLTREAFLEFCRRVAARDAIFIRHMFTRSGYNFRLELPACSPVSTVPASRAAPATTAKRGSLMLSGRKSQDKQVAGGGDLRRGASGTVGKRRSICEDNGSRNRQGDHTRRGPKEPTEYGQMTHGRSSSEDKNVRCMVSGGVVEAAELWGWTDDGRDCGELLKQGGLLSRGGGAHISHSPTSIAGTTGSLIHKASPKHPASDDNVEEGGNTPGTQKYLEGVLRIIPSSPPVDRDADKKCIPKVKGSISIVSMDQGNNAAGMEVAWTLDNSCTSKITADPASVVVPTNKKPAAGEGGEFAGANTVLNNARTKYATSRASTAGDALMCQWCGVAIGSGRAVVHSVAFCDEEALHTIPN